jgi:hypothetical protein
MATDYPFQPITPAAVAARVREHLPSLVFKTFNDLIVDAWDGREAIVSVDTASAALERNRADLAFDPRWLRIDQAYRDAGWVVLFMGRRPSLLNEWQPASFCFRLPSQT